MIKAADHKIFDNFAEMMLPVLLLTVLRDFWFSKFGMDLIANIPETYQVKYAWKVSQNVT